LKSTTYEAPHYVVFFKLMSPHPSSVQIQGVRMKGIQNKKKLYILQRIIYMDFHGYELACIRSRGDSSKIHSSDRRRSVGVQCVSSYNWL
jgi:hypothetical protein